MNRIIIMMALCIIINVLIYEMFELTFLTFFAAILFNFFAIKTLEKRETEK